jgi:hypothetical protein
MEQIINNNNTEDMNASPINFKQFIDQQKATNILEKFIQLSIQYPFQFKLSNGILSLSNSCVKWSSFIQPGFSSESIRQAIQFSDTAEHQVFSRLISYNTAIYSTRQPLIDVFKCNVLVTPRELYDLEVELFNVQQLSNGNVKFIRSFEQFMNNFNNLFFFYWYVNLMSLKIR